MTDCNAYRRVAGAGLGLATALLVASWGGDDTPFPGWGTTWKSLHPGSLSLDNVVGGTGTDCQLCHVNSFGLEPFNAYGWELRKLTQPPGNMSPGAAIAAVGGLDPDGDGFDCDTEAAANTQPGWSAGPVNTHYFKDGSTLTGQMPPAGILGAYDPCPGVVVGYCTAKTGSLGCTPAIGTTGTPSASSGAPFDVTATNVQSNTNGALVYGLSGRANLPFNGGTLCVGAPTKLAGVVNSFGNPPPADCSGVLTLDFNAHVQGAGSAAVGSLVDAQFWTRDRSDPTGFGLSDAVEFFVCP